MKRNAVIIGEVHYTSIGRSNIRDLELSKFDAIYEEGREEIFELRGGDEDSIDILLPLFFAGYLYFITLAFVVQSISKPFSSDIDLKKIAEENELDHNGNIDTEIDQFYHYFSKNTIRIVFGLITLVAVYFLFRGIAIEYYHIPPMGETLWEIPYWIVSLVVVAGNPFWFFSILALGDIFVGHRDLHMAESINEHAENNENRTIAVSVGYLHRRGISDELDELGWEIVD